MQIEFSKESGLQNSETLRQRLHEKYELQLSYGVLAPPQKELILYIFSQIHTHVHHLLERIQKDDSVSAAGRMIITEDARFAFDFDNSFCDAFPNVNESVTRMQTELRADIDHALCEYLESLKNLNRNAAEAA